MVAAWISGRAVIWGLASRWHYKVLYLCSSTFYPFTLLKIEDFEELLFI